MMSSNKKFPEKISSSPANITIICEHYYVEVSLENVGIVGEQNNKTFKKSKLRKIEIFLENVEYSKKLGSRITKEKGIPLIYQIPELHRNCCGIRFIILSNYVLLSNFLRHYLCL